MLPLLIPAALLEAMLEATVGLADPCSRRAARRRLSPLAVVGGRDGVGLRAHARPPLRGRRQCAVMSLTRGCGRGEATRVALSVHILFLLANPSRNFPLPDQIQRCSQLSCLHADLRPRAPGQQRGGA